MNDMTICVSLPDPDLTGFSSLATPVYRATTIVFPNAEAFLNRHSRGLSAYSYGLYGTPTSRVLEEQIATLEHGTGACVVPSGMAAASVTMLALLDPGARLLIPDTVYGPVRTFADSFLVRMGVEVVYYDPTLGGGVSHLVNSATKLIWVESPGSGTFEIQDVAAIAEVAKRVGALVACDNSWATPLLFRPLNVGADIVIEAISKYIAGHSDVLLGSISTNDKSLLAQIVTMSRVLGLGVSPEDCALASRGLQTLAVRLRQIGSAALELAIWLQQCPAVARVLHPALPESPGHDVWLRDFKGSSGVFGVLLKGEVADQMTVALSQLKHFRLGASFGGVNSLIAITDLTAQRTVRPWNDRGPLLRLSVGLEDPADLREDLVGFFNALVESDVSKDDPSRSIGAHHQVSKHA